MDSTFNIIVSIIDSCILKIKVDNPKINSELAEYFSFEVPNFRFTPLYQNGFWDGKIRLYNYVNSTLPCGLWKKIIQFAKEKDYSISIPSSLLPEKMTNDYFDSLYESFELPELFTKEKHQTSMIKQALENKRALILSPTSSGKNLQLYCICNALIKGTNKKALIILINRGLVTQFEKEIISYGFNGKITKYSESKDDSGQFVISTYHSLYKLPKKFFDQFEVLCFDETHRAQAKTCMTLMNKTGNINYKFGATGTLKESKCHALALEGMFGPVIQNISTRDLIKAGKIADVKIICILLNHPEEIRKGMKLLPTGTAGYQAELELLTYSVARNSFITNLVTKLQQNTLVLFRLIEHGKLLYAAIKEMNPERNVYYIDGSTKTEAREEIRMNLEKDSNGILVGSINCVGTGFSIKNLHNVIFTTPSKSKEKVVQAIGRALRKLAGKKQVNIIDIADDLSWKKKKNMTLEHFLERIQIYQQEQHPFVVKTISLT